MAALTIGRTAWTDDDGSGTTGTVVNNAAKTALYDQIDAVIASIVSATTTLNATVVTSSLTSLGNLAGNVHINTAGTYQEGARTGQLSVGFAGASAAGIYLNDFDSTAAGLFAIFGLGTGTGTSGIGSITRNAETSAVLFNTTSDKRLKNDLGRASGLTALRGLTVHDFTWKSDPTATVDRGVFAQEAIALKPLAVRRGDDESTVTDVWSVDYSKYVPDLIVGWQDHESRLLSDAAELAALKARVAVLEARN